MVHVSYWRSLEHLRNYATHSRTHTTGRAWWEKTREQWRHIGIFHETFVSSRGHYETIYENLHPFGLGDTFRSASVLSEGYRIVPAKEHTSSSMDARMGRILL